MSKLIVYNQSGYLYHICEAVYNNLKPHFTTESESRIVISNCDSNFSFNNTDVYLSFMPFNKLNIEITPKKYIIYNFEQFTTDKVWSESYINFLKNALFMIDYSIINILKFNNMKINAFYLPYEPSGIYRHLDLKNIKKDIDVLFIGTLNNRRKEWLKKLSQTNINIKIITNLFFEKSIDYFARSKIVLNIHYYKGDLILEIPRIIPALENNCIVISEDSADPYYRHRYSNIIRITTEDTFIDDIKTCLLNYNNILLESRSNFDQLVKSDNFISTSELVRFLKNSIN